MRGCNQMTSLTSPHHMAVARVTVDSDDHVLRYEVNSDALQFSFLDASWTPASWQFRDVGIDLFFFDKKGVMWLMVERSVGPVRILARLLARL